MSTKLHDLAAHTGVSTATVSRVLNGRPGVSEATRDRVIAALDTLGYERPYKLRGRSLGLVGLVIPELDNPIFPTFAQIICGALSRTGYTPLLCPKEASGISEDSYVEMLLDNRVSGIIFVAGHHADLTADKLRYQRLVSADLPVVFVNGYTDQVDAHFISDDDAVAMELVVRHLAALGHQRLGFASGPQRFIPMRRRADRFGQLLASRFGQTDPESSIRVSLLSVEGGQAAAGDLIDAGHTAIVCASDAMALGAVRAAQSRGLAVPADISVVGHDDSPLMAYVNPALTTVRQSVLAMSQAAVSILIAAVNGSAPPRGEMLFRPELIVRDSTGIVAPARPAV
ncbi:MAG: LacI family transcriptional regulator [Propionibacteriaceae bacterium]|jgi:DNA-binding LacI/PurR family transcriptional regulator|nr:LacI family transcriptional regulator [Propionibacteriaceae bacterium]